MCWRLALLTIGVQHIYAAVGIAGTSRQGLDAEVDSLGHVARLSATGVRLMRAEEFSKAAGEVLVHADVLDCAWSAWVASDCDCKSQKQSRKRTMSLVKNTDTSGCPGDFEDTMPCSCPAALASIETSRQDCWTAWSGWSPCISQVQTRSRQPQSGMTASQCTGPAADAQDCTNWDVFANYTGATLTGYIGLITINQTNFMTQTSAARNIVARMGCVPAKLVWVNLVRTPDIPRGPQSGVKLNFVIYASPCNTGYIKAAVQSLSSAVVSSIIVNALSASSPWYAATPEIVKAAVQFQTHVTGFLVLNSNEVFFSSDALVQQAVTMTVAGLAFVNPNFVTLRWSGSAETAPTGFTNFRVDFLIHVPGTQSTGPIILQNVTTNLKRETAASANAILSSQLNASGVLSKYQASAQKLALIFWPSAVWTCGRTPAFNGCNDWNPVTGIPGGVGCGTNENGGVPEGANADGSGGGDGSGGTFTYGTPTFGSDSADSGFGGFGGYGVQGGNIEDSPFSPMIFNNESTWDWDAMPGIKGPTEDYNYSNEDYNYSNATDYDQAIVRDTLSDTAANNTATERSFAPAVAGSSSIVYCLLGVVSFDVFRSSLLAN